MLYINCQTKCAPKTKADFNRYSELLIKELSLEEKELSVTLCDNEFMQNLNSKFRDEDKPTDVLSFPMDDEYILGDIIISTEQVKENAKEYGNSFFEELLYLFVHGLCHLLGHDHDTDLEIKEMSEAEQEMIALYATYGVNINGRI